VTPGNAIDYSYILRDITALRELYDIREIAFDRWGARLISQQLQEVGGDDWVVEFGQGFASMSSPSLEFEKMVLTGDIAHGGNPVLSWMADNVVVEEDAAGNIKPAKNKSTERIDGIVASIMALDRAIRHENAPSVYEQRGLFVL
jgi:phage terminase large subunit-like protein